MVTGVNLPMLLKLANLRETADLEAIARPVREHGQAPCGSRPMLLEGRG